MRSACFLLVLSGMLLLAYARHATSEAHPLLRLELFRVRTFRAAVIGSFVTRLGVGGMPFLLPLLYQIGLGYSPIQSGLLIMPQPLAAMSLKLLMPRILNRFGYRSVLLANTVSLGCLIILFMIVTPGLPVWIIVVQGLLLRFFLHVQYTSMNTLVLCRHQRMRMRSMASSIASTLQQMSMSFGVAVASPSPPSSWAGHPQASAAIMVSGIHRTFLTLGIITIVSALVFRQLKFDDGDSVSKHRSELVHGDPQDAG